MILSGYSWADVIPVILGGLVLYEIVVYVGFTYGKLIFGLRNKGYVLDDDYYYEESTERRIAEIDELDESAYDSIECIEVGDNSYSHENDTTYNKNYSHNSENYTQAKTNQDVTHTIIKEEQNKKKYNSSDMSFDYDQVLKENLEITNNFVFEEDEEVAKRNSKRRIVIKKKPDDSSEN